MALQRHVDLKRSEVALRRDSLKGPRRYGARLTSEGGVGAPSMALGHREWHRGAGNGAEKAPVNRELPCFGAAARD